MGLLNSIVNILRFKRNWKAVILCALAATVFWFFNALNKTYTSNISFPLSFDFDQQYYIPVTPLPQQIKINVTGNGWDLFRRSAGLKIPPLVIPIDRPSEVKKIVGSTLPALFSNQLNTLQINFVVTDTVYLDVEPKVKRWLSLRVDSISRYISANYGVVSEVTIEPDSVFIEGPFSIITSLHEPYGISLNDRNIDDNYSESIELRFPQKDDLITRNPSAVNVSFSVDPIVEVSDQIELLLINIPATANPQIGTKEISVSFRLPESYAETLQIDSIKAILDLKELKRGRSKMIPEIVGLPEHSEITRLDTINIMY